MRQLRADREWRWLIKAGSESLLLFAHILRQFQKFSKPKTLVGGQQSVVCENKALAATRFCFY
ncbi:MAG TPA: hypothetical protein VF766_09250 [Pyrinomonadaceae bacterium]